MDVLADVVDAMRTGSTTSARAELRAPWALRIAPTGGATFHVVLEGSSWLTVGGGDPVPLGAGDVVLLPRGPAHVIGDHPETPPIDFGPIDRLGRKPDVPSFGDGPQRSLMLCGTYHVERDRPHPLLAGLPDVVHVRSDRAEDRSLRSAITLLSDEVDTTRPGATAVTAAFVDAILPLTLRAWIDGCRDCMPDRGWSGAFDDVAIAGALEAVHESPGDPWSVASLAREVGLSRAAFARRFLAATGEPPMTYLTRWRMTVAAQLLRDGDLTLADVADAVGYRSEFAFAKAFKRDYGVGPGGYRRQAAAAVRDARVGS